MFATLLGTQNVNFTNAHGEHVVGLNLFVAFQDANVTGMRTEKFFIKDVQLPSGLKIQDSINIEFNYKGKIEKITKPT